MDVAGKVLFRTAPHVGPIEDIREIQEDDALSVLAGGTSAVDFYIGLTLFGSLVSGFLIYLVTRHGLRGAFSKFHVGAERDIPFAGDSG